MRQIFFRFSIISIQKRPLSIWYARFNTTYINPLFLHNIFSLLETWGNFTLSIADRFCSRRDAFINDILRKFDEGFNISVKPLIVFIKYWSKQKGINNAYYCYLNSFGYTLLVIKFLQYYCYHTHQQSKPKTNCSKNF